MEDQHYSRTHEKQSFLIEESSRYWRAGLIHICDQSNADEELIVLIGSIG
jgi:hypothetical protein